MRKYEPPWASGPGEILRHGISLLRDDSDTNRRLALIAIDNAVELTLKTYLGLPKRITKLQIPRKELAEISESFPALLDAIEKYAADKVAGIDLGEIEWYHRLRNQLYHQGNGLTVERNKVEVYAQLANALFRNLFDFELVHPPEGHERRLGEFLGAWIELEKSLWATANDHSVTGAHGRSSSQVMTFLQRSQLLDAGDRKEFLELRDLRNKIVHGLIDADQITTTHIARLKAIRDRFADKA